MGPCEQSRWCPLRWANRSYAGCKEHISASVATRILSALIGYVYGARAFVFMARLLRILACIAESGLTVGFPGNVTATPRLRDLRHHWRSFRLVH
jgi:hypothetical protein